MKADGRERVRALSTSFSVQRESWINTLSRQSLMDWHPLEIPAVSTLSPQLLRGELIELQGAQRGRKFGYKDRRPVAPPSVVQLRLFQTLGDGIEREVEDYSLLQSYPALTKPLPPS
ncbi:hypothetical protein PUNSTDRAFT_112850 [Punctularia strigosozonata HHB-11173 SS5]|uniref:uncharacterized protein n=1 Tax=Punctularia strigosozonata (strain HHB-11173) TaxID=741275 RepID=UPI000441810A|nr:uncharacterized protein PUNSTDRAFT_112850 [Punctularia strigosozonata HHB-11173 SS5]EIN11091.1 hypothetical protein PUNSTDRAFT_112850 [Punctularia strigosozonata HHB-11173 SS5]